MGYSPKGRKELDTTERLSTHTHESVSLSCALSPGCLFVLHIVVL